MRTNYCWLPAPNRAYPLAYVQHVAKESHRADDVKREFRDLSERVVYSEIGMGSEMY